MPAAGAYRTAEGAIVVPWDKEWIKSATKATRDHILTEDQRDELRTHYAADLSPWSQRYNANGPAQPSRTGGCAQARRPGASCIAA